MRYRKLSYSYAMVLRTRAPRPYSNPWFVTQTHVTLAQPEWCPAADVYELPDAVSVTLELPGIDPDEVDVLLYEDAVVVEGVRQLAPAPPNARYHAAEIRQGRFRVELPLPGAVDPEQVDARYERGLLIMNLVKQGERTGT